MRLTPPSSMRSRAVAKARAWRTIASRCLPRPRPRATAWARAATSRFGQSGTTISRMQLPFAQNAEA
eukprot:8967428-Pyramimonas_sp.AAC.1